MDDTFAARATIAASIAAAIAFGLLVLAAAPLAPLVPSAWSQDGPVAPGALIPLTPHRAIYDLSLGDVRGNSSISSVRGRILYDFDGNACQGYSLEFRQVSELDTGEGKTSTSDLRSTTWEGADAKKFKFSSENFVDESLAGAVDGHAEHDPDKTAVALEKPSKKPSISPPASCSPPSIWCA